jgi:hypothetical protein
MDLSLLFLEKLDPRGNSLSVGCFEAKFSRAWLPPNKGLLVDIVLQEAFIFISVYLLPCPALRLFFYVGSGDKSGNIS